MSTPELRAQASDPTTDLATLGAIAHEHPALRPAVALNPSAYEGLLDWLSQLDDPAVRAALAQRNGGAPAVPAAGSWREPNRAVALAWGSYGLRYGISLGLFLAALLVPFYLVAPGGGYLPLAIIAVCAIAAAAVMPAPLVRRVVAASLVVTFVVVVVISTLSAQGYLSNVIYGIFRFIPTETGVSLAVWFVLRQRSALSYLLLPLAWIELLVGPLVFEGVIDFFFGFGFGGESFGARELLYRLAGYSTLLFHAAFVIAVVWLARLISVARGNAVAAGPDRLAAQSQQRESAHHQARVAQIHQWEAAYRDAHNGAEPPPGFMPPVAPATSGSTNTMAILALVFGFGGGLLGIVFGHMARSQIRRTGEGGWALATVGLVLGYIGLAAIVLILAFYVWIALALRF